MIVLTLFLQYRDLTTKLADPDQLRSKPDVSELKFGQIFTDHMLKVFYHKQLGGWQKPVIIPFENISLHPAAKVLHYAVEVNCYAAQPSPNNRSDVLFVAF
jgi:branched-chain amino acid aminotransferase